MFELPKLWLVLVTGLLCARPLAWGADSLSLAPSGPRAKVVSVQNPSATFAFKPRADVVAGMLNRGLTNLTGRATVAAAWASLVGPNDTVGVKVYTAPGANTGTRIEVVAAVVDGLLSTGIPTNHIIVWDRHTADLRQAGYQTLTERFGIRVTGAAEAGFDAETYYDTALLGSLVYGDLEFGQKEEGVGRRSYISKLVTRQMSKIINIAPVVNHNGAGVAGNLFSLALGSVDNVIRFTGSPDRLATAVPEIYALPALGDRVVLNISDALICQYVGEERGLLHYSVELNEIRLSHDPVALDTLALHDLERLRRRNFAGDLPANWELYKNAALLELGVNDLKRIEVTLLNSVPQGEGDTRTR